MTILVESFRGISPKIATDKIGPDMGQTVQDAKTSSKDLVAYKRSLSDVALTGSSYKTFFEYLESGTSHWAFYDKIVHWARSPVADDTYERMYMTGGPATKAQGTVTFLDSITDAETVTIGADTYEFDIDEDGVAGGNILVGDSTTTTKEHAAAALVAVSVASGTEDVTLTDNGDGTVLVEYDTAGVAGNAIAFSNTGDKVSTNTYGATSFLGGTQEGLAEGMYRAFANDLVSATFDPDNDVYRPGAPSGAAPTVTPESGGADYAAYFYTYVSRYGEEGPPSAIGESVAATDDSRNFITNLTYPTQQDLYQSIGTAIPGINLYRTIETGDGAALFAYVLTATYFDEAVTYVAGDYVLYDDGGAGLELWECTVGGIGTWAAGTHDFVSGEAITDANLEGGVCSSIYYDQAPAGMTNLRAHPNGFFVASKTNVLYCSEPYLPNAWPEDYRIPLDAQIVGIGIHGSTIVVATDAFIYTFAGPHPSSLYKSRLSFQPCLSQRALVETDSGVMFPSLEGFQLVTAGGVQNVTQDLFDPDDWADYELDTMHGTYYNKSYYGFYKSADYEGAIRIDFINGSIQTGQKYHYAGYVAIADGIFRTITNSNIDAPTVLYIARWDYDNSSYRNYKFKSKRYIYRHPLNMKVAQVILDSEFYDDVLEIIGDNDTLEDLNETVWLLESAGGGTTDWGAGDLGGTLNGASIHSYTINGDALYSLVSLGVQNYVEFRLYADGVLKFTKYVMNSNMFKLPRGYRDKKWEFEVEGMIPIKRVIIATTTEEIVQNG